MNLALIRLFSFKYVTDVDNYSSARVSSLRSMSAHGRRPLWFIDGSGIAEFFISNKIKAGKIPALMFCAIWLLLVLSM